MKDENGRVKFLVVLFVCLLIIWLFIYAPESRSSLRSVDPLSGVSILPPECRSSLRSVDCPFERSLLSSCSLSLFPYLGRTSSIQKYKCFENKFVETGSYFRNLWYGFFSQSKLSSGGSFPPVKTHGAALPFPSFPFPHPLWRRKDCARR